MLQIPEPHCGNISSAIAGLEQLETLWLANNGPVAQTTGALQLSALKSLRSLALISVVPESISCNDSCELHVDVDIESMDHPVWDTVLPRLRSVQLAPHNPCHSFNLAALPSMLLKAGNLLKAELTMPHCGTATVPLLLGGSLAHVAELVVDCLELHAIVPAHVTWRNVCVAAEHLNLRFEAVVAFGEVIPAFCFRFNKLQVCYDPTNLLHIYGHHSRSCT